ncbi:precorrin-3B synthase [Agrobacterium rubi]|uniref:Precorrin-3B synthase n=1 Tax=Agrobacterium rubi TaxID=28099 RepID=A0AAE7R2I1_9HYPH|nr:precorrin-3B synthase [Agrobacterium rubi]NTE87579.1 precorrin-3B synthase [Agrobacterium rubi]NTF03433.1 precorrin-3B synthase [Agrobacterium rubi]NTF37593.1 precorrin-3B synthase [Agrobacterium rubi]OCJ45711.1 precorrin-3B synthase [Agrobacterium rubi]QTG00241.1 precorrin-3B synthase [Agrobacterium rubi]
MSAFGPVDVQPFTRRGVCPALSAPMQTGDGLLSRIAFTDHVSPSDLEALCALAMEHGNGLMDITARGGLQFRGLTPESAEVLERDVLALDLPLRQGLTVETSPLTGIDETELADTCDIVSRICERADALQLHEKLAAKMSVIVDGGGLVDMGDLLADIRLKAVRVGGVVLWQLMLGGAEGNALQAGLLRTEDAADSVIDLLICLVERGSNTRGRDFDVEQVRAVCAGRLLDSPYPSTLALSRYRDLFPGGEEAETRTIPGHNDAGPYGLMRLSDDVFAAVVAPAFGQIGADVLSALCRYASTLGLQRLRPGPAHALFFTGSDNACLALLDHARDAGFVTGADDPRSSIAVCAGKPACASGFISTRDLAEHAATDCASLLDGSFTLHLSGCGKGCAHPSPATLAFAGSSEGLAFTHSGRVSDTPQAVLPLADRKAALSRLARLYEKEHKPGENARILLARLGKDRIVAALRQDTR